MSRPTARTDSRSASHATAVLAWVVAAWLASAGAATAAETEPQPDMQAIAGLLDAAETLLDEGKPVKAADRVGEAARAIGRLAEGGGPAALRGLWERCKALRETLELEGADTSAIDLPPLRGVGKGSARKDKPADGKKETAGAKPPPNAKPGASVKPGAIAKPPANAKPKAKPNADAKPGGNAQPAITFSGNVAPILVRHCGGCHVAGRKGGFQMASYAGLMRSGAVQPGAGAASRLVEAILSGDMPRGGGKVPPDDVGVLMKWIDMGAPFDGSDPTAALDVASRAPSAAPAAAAKPAAAVKLKPGEISFAGEVAPILVEQCVGCHDAVQPEGQLSMVTLERLARGGRNGAAFVAGRGAESLLVKKLKGKGIEGQRMPLGRDPLADDVIAVIEKWVDQGARLDLLTPRTELETLAAAGRAGKLAHPELRAVRFEAGKQLWSRAIPDEKAGVVERGDTLVVGNVSPARLEGLADAAEAVERRLRGEIVGKDGPLLKGGLVVYGFAKTYDFSSFWQTVLSDERPQGIKAGAGVSGDVAYAALVPPAGDASGPKSEAAADMRAILTEQVTAAALLGRGLPAWFARGAGRALALRTEPKAPLVQAWKRDIPAAVQRQGSAADFFAGAGDMASAATVGGGFLAALMPGPGRLEALVRQVDDGVPFDTAFAAVFQGPPQKLFEAFIAQPAKGPRR